MFIKYKDLQKLFVSEINEELSRFLVEAPGIITEKDIEHLPEPVKKYFRYCGLIGKNKIMNAKIEWKDVYLKRGFNEKWMSMYCSQFNSVAEPTRIVFMKAKILGMIPFEGRDKCQHGHGHMLIKLLRMFTIADAKGKEMDASALVTVLAEALLVPGYALQKYIKWTPIDIKSAKATLTWKECEVSGIFFFNDKGEFERFETTDRYYSTTGKDYKKIKWTATVDIYHETNGIRCPAYFRATWNTEKGDLDYFKGSLATIRYNIRNY